MNSVCVHGLGYVGLPTAAMLANFGHDVVGYDTNTAVIERLEQDEFHFDEPGLEAFVTRAFERATFEISDEVVPAEYQLVCVPTPFDPDAKSADLTHVENAVDGIVPHLEAGVTVVLESTVPPGTTEEVVRPILERSGLTAGEEFGLAHCPETVLPGKVIAELRANDRVIGAAEGHDPQATIQLYESFVDGTVYAVENATAAEFVKLIQNTYRDVNIALANEVATIAADYGIDARRAIDRANLHPRVDFLAPGPGVGGHCLPIDPWFLSRGSDRLELIRVARRVNDSMVDFVIEQLETELEGLESRRIAVLGAAYKANVDDTRRSPGIRLVKRLEQTAAQQPDTIPTANDGDRDGEGSRDSPADETGGSIDVVLSDPRVNGADLELQPVSGALTGADAIVLTVAHDEFASLDPEDVGARMNRRVIVDTRGVLDPQEWTNAGFRFRRI